MERLSEIMNNLTGIEGLMESISSVLDALDDIYEYWKEYEAQSTVQVFKTLVDSMHDELGERISEIDRFLLDSKRWWGATWKHVLI